MCKACVSVKCAAALREGVADIMGVQLSMQSWCKVQFVWVPRDLNAAADELATAALETQQSYTRWTLTPRETQEAWHSATEIIINFDGGCAHQLCSAGVSISIGNGADNGGNRCICSISHYIGAGTNNLGELVACRLACASLLNLGARCLFPDAVGFVDY